MLSIPDVQHCEVLDDAKPSTINLTPHSKSSRLLDKHNSLGAMALAVTKRQRVDLEIGHQRPNHAGCSVEEINEASTTASACIRPINASPLKYPTSSMRLDVAPIAQLLLNHFCCNAMLVVEHRRSEKK